MKTTRNRKSLEFTTTLAAMRDRYLQISFTHFVGPPTKRVND